MYKNIIFDLGNVVLNYNPEEYLKTKIKKSNKISEIHKAIFKSKEWEKLDRGIITEKEAIDIIVKNSMDNEKLIKLAFENWYELLTPIEETVEVLRDLKNYDYKIYFLSNFHLLAFEYIIRKYEFFNLFDGGIVSYKEKLLKPEDKIYKRILEEYAIKAEESIFIDDVECNVEAAKKLNFSTIFLKDPKNLRKSLKQLNIKI